MYICENCYTEYSKELTCCNELVTNLVEVSYQELDFNEPMEQADEWFTQEVKAEVTEEECYC